MGRDLLARSGSDTLPSAAGQERSARPGVLHRRPA